MKYICNDIQKPFRVSILHYTNIAHYIHDLEKYLLPTTKKRYGYHQADWRVCNREFTEDEIRVANKYGINQYTKDEIEDKDQDYHALPHK